MKTTSKCVVLNKVDKYVKSLMLTYPSIMPSRFAVLKQLFLTNGNGMEWNSSGELVYSCGKEKLSKVMTFDDIEQLERHLGKIAEAAWSKDFAGTLLLKNSFHRLARQYIADNIDLFAKYDIDIYEKNLGYSAHWLRHIDPDWTCLSLENPTKSFNMPKTIAPEWADAAMETLDVVIMALSNELGMNYDGFDESKADKELLGKYNKFMAIKEVVEKNTSKSKTVANLEKKLLTLS
jgi:hypothetical protein